MKSTLKLLVLVGLTASVVGCGHSRKHRMHDHSKMTPEHHETMAKAHTDTAACLKEGKKSKEECAAIMKEAKKATCPMKKDGKPCGEK